MHFRIVEMIATTGFLTALECIKFVYGQGLPRTPLEELTVPPAQTASWFKGAILLRDRERI